jgi:hypothetical protein
MSRRRVRRRSGKSAGHASQSPASSGPRPVVREATYVERLAYTRSQAADALGISRSTLIRRVLPYVDTIEMPWGAKLIPVDELERLLGERRRRASDGRRPQSRPGRKIGVSSEIVARIQVERGRGMSFAAIARALNADGAPTAQGGRSWWPSTVRAVLLRTSRLKGPSSSG